MKHLYFYAADVQHFKSVIQYVTNSIHVRFRDLNLAMLSFVDSCKVRLLALNRILWNEGCSDALGVPPLNVCLSGLFSTES